MRCNLVSRAVAAEMLRVSEETMVRLARSWCLEEFRVGKRAVRVDEDSVLQHIESRRLPRRPEESAAA
jgi:hypothetical protein